MTRRLRIRGVGIDYPGDELFNAFLLEFDRESDRAAAIVGAAVLDTQIEEIIRRFLIDDPKTVKKAFSQDGPLATFSARIDLAYLLNLISNDDRHDLNIVREVRNKFAHRLDAPSFREPTISSRTKELRTPKAYNPFKELNIPNPSARDLFVFSVAQLALMLRINIVSGEHPERRLGTGQKRQDPSTRLPITGKVIAYYGEDTADVPKV